MAAANLQEKVSALEEAEIFAAESRRTLEEARYAVAAASGARQYYNPGKPWNPKGPGKGGTGKFGKNPGKPGSAGKNSEGTCIICHAPNHGYKNLPDRGKTGKGRGKFGKRPKGSYWSDGDWDEWSVWCYFSTSLCTIYSVFVGSFRSIIDTGTMQTAGGADAFQSLIDFLLRHDPNFCFWVDVNDRPSFHFGDGGYLRASSRVWLTTSLGEIGIYVVEAPGVPILIGADLLDARGILISFRRNLAIFENVPSQPVVALERSSSGHRLLDLTAAPVGQLANCQ